MTKFNKFLQLDFFLRLHQLCSYASTSIPNSIDTFFTAIMFFQKQIDTAIKK